MLLLDVAVQCGQVANQACIFALRPEFRSRLNTAYMTCSFLGGSAGRPARTGPAPGRHRTPARRDTDRGR